MTLESVPRVNPVPWLKTVGNKIVVASIDQEVTLRGANVMRSEWNATMEVKPEDRDNCALTRKAWDPKMDFERAAIRVLAGQPKESDPLEDEHHWTEEDHWKGNVILRGFASDPVNTNDSQYLGVLDEHVALAEANRMYVIFAWRSLCINGPQPRSPGDQAQQALVRLAVRYRGKPNVMYALQVEPHDVSWDELQPRYVQMVDAIQAAASPYKPIIMIPGIDWSRDLSGAIKKWVPRDNVVYKSHPYNSQVRFQQQFIEAYDAGLPVFLGEFAWTPNEWPNGGMHLDDVNALLSIAHQRNIGWTAWILDVPDPQTKAFEHTGLVTDNFTFHPTSVYGVAVKNEMRTTPPLPTDDGALTTSIDDTAFKYTGIWHPSSGPAKFHGGDHYSDVANSSYQVSFTSTQIKLYGATARWHGIAGVSIDDDPEEMIDCHSQSRTDQALIYTSPPLTAAPHTLTVRVTGTKNPNSTGTVVTADRADITSPVAAPAGSYLTTTYDTNGFFHLNSGLSDYVGYKPDTYSDATSISLFVWMHGCGGVADGDMWKIAPPETRESQSYIAVSLGGKDNDCWDVDSDGPKLLAAVKDVQRYFNINPRKIYVGGYSSGGDMAYRHGFEHAGTFAGILVENSDPFSDTHATPTALMNAASWKINIAHVAHKQDTAYPVVTVTGHFDQLTGNGFPTNLIVKDGTHYDPDDPGKKTGTDYDLIHELLPFLERGWVSP